MRRYFRILLHISAVSIVKFMHMWLKNQIDEIKISRKKTAKYVGVMEDEHIIALE